MSDKILYGGMFLVAIALVVLGIAAIILGFQQILYPRARDAGAIFLASGCVMFVLVRISGQLQAILAALKEKSQAP